MSHVRLVPLKVLLVLLSLTLTAGEPSWRLAPLSPEYIRSLHNLPTRSLAVNGNLSLSRPLASPLDLSRLSSRGILQSFPRRFDLRTMGRLPQIRDQDGYPACQAFATMGVLESMLLPDEVMDFSEWHIYRHHGFDPGMYYGSNPQGGNWQMNAAYLLRWSGPVDEADYRYGQGNASGIVDLPLMKHVQDVVFFPPRRDPLDNAAVKNYLMHRGPLYASIYYDSYSFNSATASHYYSGAPDTNHGVILVGWDDDYDRFRFLQAPPGNGAFILRNSWGGQWGDGGYFYMSYYDHGITPRMGFPRLEETANYGRVYQYDPLGAVSLLGSGTEHAWGANAFTAVETGQLAAVGFYLVDTDSHYTIRVYRRVGSGSPDGGELFTEQEGSRENAGFVTVPLEEPMPLTAGERFAVVVHFRTPGSPYPIAVEYPVPGYSSAAVAAPGQSYVSQDGESWDDLTGLVPDANVCIKAYSAFSSPLTADLTAELRHAEGWMLSYPYVRVAVSVDPAGMQAAFVYIFRRTDDGAVRKVHEIPPADLTGGEMEWLDTAVATGRSYAYQVRCFADGGLFLGQSDWSEVEVTQ